MFFTMESRILSTAATDRIFAVYNTDQPLMKRAFFFGLLLLIGASVSGQNAKQMDTVFIKRPYYLGVTYSAAKFITPARYQDVSEDNNTEIYSGQSVGVAFAFPFLRKWDLESNFEFTTWSGWQNSHGTHMVPQSNPVITWETWSSHAIRRNFYMLRSIASYELFVRNAVTLQVGAGGRLAVSETFNLVPGNLIGECGIKMMYNPNRNYGMQIGAWFGKSQYGEYASLRIALFLKGQRTYRARPFHYYVRTYEYGE